jgi:hypothetical protein
MSEQEVSMEIDRLLQTSRYQELIKTAARRVNSQGIVPMLDGQTQKRP